MDNNPDAIEQKAMNCHWMSALCASLPVVSCRYVDG